MATFKVSATVETLLIFKSRKEIDQLIWSLSRADTFPFVWAMNKTLVEKVEKKQRAK